MFASWENSWGLDFVQTLVGTRGPLGDLLAQALHFSGETLFFLVVLPTIYWGVDRKLGIRLLFALTTSYALGTLLKTQLAAPRPFHIAPELISPLFEQDGYGFPSNHVLLAVAVWGYLASYLRSRGIYFAVTLFVVAQMWSRIYAGVHFFHDAIGGLVFGFIALWIFTQALRYLPPRWLKWSDTAKYSLTIGSGSLIYLILSQSEDATAVVGLWLGCSLGIILREKMTESNVSGSYIQRLIRTFFGLLILVTFFYTARYLFASMSIEGSTIASLLRTIRYSLTTILGLTFIPQIFLRLNLALPAGHESRTSS